MNTLVTGGTGFIGQYLLANLAKRDGKIFVLVRQGSEGKLAQICERHHLSPERFDVIHGDITQPGMGVSDLDKERLIHNVDEFVHGAAIYDITASAEQQAKANVDGTRHALDLANAIQAKCFNHVSSIAVAGFYNGVFNEHMFEQGVGLDLNPYLRTKYESEALVRDQDVLPYRIFRPSMVLGHSKTGHIDKIDGPYYLFKTLQKLRNILPSWMPMLGVKGGKLNMVPVDYVADAMDHILAQSDTRGQVYHLVDKPGVKMVETLDIFSRAAHGSRISTGVSPGVLDIIPAPIRSMVFQLPAVKHLIDQTLASLNIPEEALKLLELKTEYDDSNTQKALAGSSIAVPPLQSYAGTLWDYWERNLDPQRQGYHTLEERMDGKVVMITGASSGIGLSLAQRLAGAGATVLMVARNQEKLAEVQEQILMEGGEAKIYPCDLNDLNAVDNLVTQVLEEHERVDVLVNNAGRSIRRSLKLSYDRFHDFERTMQLNYFAPVRLTMGLLPRMVEQGGAQVVNISSIAVLPGYSPRFAAYVASKSALDAWARSAGAEYREHEVHFTTVHMPLVRTPMIEATPIYQFAPTLNTDEAVGLIEEAILERPGEVNTGIGSAMRAASIIAPKMYELLMSTTYKMFPDSAAAQGLPETDVKPTAEQVALSALLSGSHL